MPKRTKPHSPKSAATLAASDPPASTRGESRERLQIHYEKSSQFRTVYMTGAIGGVTPDGTIRAALYNQRLPLPRRTLSEMSDGRAFEIPEEREVDSGFVREIEADVVMDLTTAKSFRDWLSHRIHQLENAIATPSGPDRQ